MNQTDKKKILILSYFFPPCNKVGGRRWAKFAKYLSKLGNTIHVVCVDYPFTGTCPWEGDIKEFEKNVIRIPYKEHRPFYQINRSPDTLIGKIKYRLSWYGDKYLSQKIKGDAQDISLAYGIQLRNMASEIIEKNNIDTVIITGGPFQWCYDSIQLKKKYSHIKFALDLRDFWTGGENYSKLNNPNKAIEDAKEHDCVLLADVITTPAERISQYLKTKYKNYAQKVHVLPHGFDKDELPKQTNIINESKSIHFIYGGILYEKMELAIKQFAEIIIKLQESGYSVRADIYTFGEKYREVFGERKLDHIVKYHATLTAKDFFLKCAQADFLLQFRAGEANEQHFKSTKFYEQLALKKFVIYFGPDGEVSDYLLENGVGFSFTEGAEKLTKNIVEAKQGKLKLKDDLSIDQFSYNNLTENLIKLLDK